MEVLLSRINFYTPYNIGRLKLMKEIMDDGEDPENVSFHKYGESFGFSLMDKLDYQLLHYPNRVKVI